MKVKDYIEQVENDCSQVMLINKDTGQLWGVDRYALKERGYPEDGWQLLEDTSRIELMELIYKLRGIDNITED